MEAEAFARVFLLSGREQPNAHEKGDIKEQHDVLVYYSFVPRHGNPPHRAFSTNVLRDGEKEKQQPTGSAAELHGSRLDDGSIQWHTKMMGPSHGTTNN